MLIVHLQFDSENSCANLKSQKCEVCVQNLTKLTFDNVKKHKRSEFISSVLFYTQKYEDKRDIDTKITKTSNWKNVYSLLNVKC